MSTPSSPYHYYSTLSRSCNDVALNLTKPKQRDDQQQLQRSEFNFAIPRPSAAVPKEVSWKIQVGNSPNAKKNLVKNNIFQNELKRTHTAPLLEVNSQQQQPNFGGVSLLKRPLQQQQQQQQHQRAPPQDQPMELTARPPKQVMRLVGFGGGSNASNSRSHETSSPTAANRTFITISRPVQAAASAAVSLAKVPHTLHRAATL